MKFFLSFLAALLVAGCQSTIESDETVFDPLSSMQQLILVTTPNWQTTPGTLRRFERINPKAKWREAGSGFPVVVGRNGLGWGSGIHPTVISSGPKKKEGDGKSPAGIFRLSSAFGLESNLQVVSESGAMSEIKLPYRQLDSDVECVDDVKSGLYNSIVNRGKVNKPDWDSSERMREMGECYRLGIVVDHNMSPTRPGGGSCIFLHIWKNSESGTSGCTAMTQENIEKLLAWLDPQKNPALVQLPDQEYQRLLNKWNLP